MWKNDICYENIKRELAASNALVSNSELFALEAKKELYQEISQIIKGILEELIMQVLMEGIPDNLMQEIVEELPTVLIIQQMPDELIIIEELPQQIDHQIIPLIIIIKIKIKINITIK